MRRLIGSFDSVSFVHSHLKPVMDVCFLTEPEGNNSPRRLKPGRDETVEIGQKENRGGACAGGVVRVFPYMQ